MTATTFIATDTRIQTFSNWISVCVNVWNLLLFRLGARDGAVCRSLSCECSISEITLWKLSLWPALISELSVERSKDVSSNIAQMWSKLKVTLTCYRSSVLLGWRIHVSEFRATTSIFEALILLILSFKGGRCTMWPSSYQSCLRWVWTYLETKK